jgi:hypothetical protein
VTYANALEAQQKRTDLWKVGSLSIEVRELECKHEAWLMFGLSISSAEWTDSFNNMKGV